MFFLFVSPITESGRGQVHRLICSLYQGLLCLCFGAQVGEIPLWFLHIKNWGTLVPLWMSNFFLNKEEKRGTTWPPTMLRSLFLRYHLQQSIFRYIGTIHFGLWIVFMEQDWKQYNGKFWISSQAVCLVPVADT